MRKCRITESRLLFVMIMVVMLPVSLWAYSGESLIIFTNKSMSPVNTVFQNKTLPDILNMAKEMNVNVLVDKLEKGAPEDVTITPLIVYQNHLGRSIYQGRTNTTQRIKNFIRTSRRIPQGKEKFVLDHTPVMVSGRGAVYSPLKVSDLGGTRPDGYTDQAFHDESIAAIVSGFSSFAMKDKTLVRRGDRGFYMDFYPWRGGDGTLFISLALYSQFHCKKPVFELKENKIIGPWDRRKDLFKQAGSMMEAEVKKHLADPYGGDGFDFVSLKTPVATWESLGYALPPVPRVMKNVKPTVIKLPTAWHVPAKPLDDEPMIQFHFPAPLDNYAGEFKMTSGQINFPVDLAFSGMKGRVRAHSDSVTMGETDLDKVIKSALFLDLDNHPYSEFTLASAASQDKQLSFGRMSIVQLTGTFSLKGRTIPLSLPVEIEPVLDDAGSPVLIVQGSFPIDLRLFNIEGATGPEPQKYTLEVELHITMTPGSG